jgi:hypothetical protein
MGVSSQCKSDPMIGLLTHVHRSYCVSDTFSYNQLQFWDISGANTTNPAGGRLALSSSETLCLDAGSTATNGTFVTLRTCDGNAIGQRWNYVMGDALTYLTLSTGNPFQDGKYLHNL